jgi:glutamine synthetase adenylyltransferase
MVEPTEIEKLIAGLPDPDAARRFYSDFTARYPQHGRIGEALLSDLLTVAAYSPLLSTTLLQNSEYIQWLGRERVDTKVRSKDDLLESLSRFSLLQSDISANIMLARFRRRELLRIFLRDIRRLATIAEITEELSNLADAVIEFSLRLARQDLENRFGVPLETDDRGRSSPAGFSVVALGKLGSHELNYASDIDLLFIYSSEGSTSETSPGGSISNREFFIKLAEKVIQIAGGQSGEGAAYRIDMRLRPHGSIGRLALSLDETIRYYQSEAREWEQQVLIRSRPIAGDGALYKQFFSQVENRVFRKDINVSEALANVRRSKRRIEDPTPPGRGYNVKLGRGGIREIEFIAQALQLAYGGGDKWLRFPHTLVSLSRLVDRRLIDERRLTGLHDAYDFLRRVEHLLQMEHGLQTHTVPKSEDHHTLLARRAGFQSTRELDQALFDHSQNVQSVFESVFGSAAEEAIRETESPAQVVGAKQEESAWHQKIAAISPYFAQLAATTEKNILKPQLPFSEALSPVLQQTDFGKRLSLLRRAWTRSLLSIASSEINDDISTREAKDLQTELAEASVKTALAITRDEMRRRYDIENTDLSVLALGKLGGRGVDYGSDLDLVLVYPDETANRDKTAAEIYARAVEIFVTALSGMTRDGNLYRVDLRLRPFGKNGATANPRSVFIDYFRSTAAIWELLAFVKLRGVTGSLAEQIESEVRDTIHQRVYKIDREQLRSETLRIRYLLERERAGRHRETDIKYGPGGMLDVYFATRYLQLRDTVPDPPDDRSTIAVLRMLFENASLNESDHDSLSSGYAFLSELDHNIRLTTGRSRRLRPDPEIQETIARRMSLSHRSALSEALALHRINIRNAFEETLR